MPATYAHYKFGKKVYRALPGELREMIKENKAAYLLGLHGPDLLFYYHSYSKNRINQLGVKMHEETARSFFEKARKQYQKRPNYVLLSYLCGFMCHYMLDSECHPYISRYMDERGLGHLEIETDFDRELMIEDGKDPLTNNCTRHLIRDLDTEEAIASVLDDVTADQVDACILGFKKTIRMFQCPSKAKAKLLKGFFSLIGQKKGLGGLVMDGQVNLECVESGMTLERLLNRAVEPTTEEIVKYVQAISNDSGLSERLNRDIE